MQRLYLDGGFRIFGKVMLCSPSNTCLLSSSPSWLDVRPHILERLQTNKPVIAFETAIVSHGLPRPANINLNKDINIICKKYAVTPAPIGFIDGKLIIGLNTEELSYLGSGLSNIEKIARLDIAKALSMKKSGGTTVSGTMWAAHAAGIKIFVTGGIGGVHRGWKDSFDISSDLTELGRTPVAVVCAGAKSILDIPATLEYLETAGVPVATFHPDGFFPAFHSRSSGVSVPLRLASISQGVELLRAHFSMKPPPSGVVVACPIPKQFAISESAMEARIQQALKLAEASSVTGKDTTPFLLSKIAETSDGETVEANVGLVLNNTEIGCQLAVGVSNCSEAADTEVNLCSKAGRPVIFGGAVLDAYGKFLNETPGHTQATEPGRVFLSAGGVGRNVADCIARVMDCSKPSSGQVEQRPLFGSVLADDTVGKLVVSLTSPKLDVAGVKWLSKENTGFYSPSYIGTLSKSGSYLVGIGDFVAMEKFQPRDVALFEEAISKAPLVVTDCNLKPAIFLTLFEMCSKYKVPLYIESTDIYKTTKPFSALGPDITERHYWQTNCVGLISPNFEEFVQLVKFFFGDDAAKKCKSVSGKTTLNEHDFVPLVEAGKKLIMHCNFPPNIFLKLGHHGLIIFRRDASDQLPLKPWTKQKRAKPNFSAVFYGAEPPGSPPDVVSVSGAGDCFIGTVVGLLSSSASRKTFNFDEAIRAAIKSACLSLESEAAVPESISPHFLTSQECIEWCKRIPCQDISQLAA